MEAGGRRYAGILLAGIYIVILILPAQTCIPYYHYIFDHVLAHYFSGTKVRFDDFRKESRILDTSEMVTTSPFRTPSSMSI